MALDPIKYNHKKAQDNLVAHVGAWIQATGSPPSKSVDDLAWEKDDREAEAWERSLLKEQVCRDVGSFINKYRPVEPVELHSPSGGGYNIFYRLEYKDGSSAALKIPCKGLAADDLAGTRPSIIMDHAEQERTMSEALNDPVISFSESHVLDPNVDAEKLEVLYAQMANIVLLLSTLQFDRIGSLVQDRYGGFDVSR
ncbi:Ff.00g013350.m01.CDS01 [Fusarium sp. VM40]|nr:Ff.00g013350.m01.CDS01 [Fusarium sp. VM40]